MFAQGYLTAFLLGTLNFVEVRYTLNAGGGYQILPVTNVWRYSDLDDMLQYTFDYAQKAPENGYSADQVLCMTTTGIVMRYKWTEKMPGKVLVPFDGDPHTEDTLRDVKEAARMALLIAKPLFDDADRDQVNRQIRDLERKIEELRGQL